jgi:hypothetical protein
LLRVKIEILKGADVWEDLVSRVCAPPAQRFPEIVLA